MPHEPFSWQLRVRFVDTDASGRIHYTAMLRFFEAAEAEFLRSLGVLYSSIENEQTSYPRVHVECTYTDAVLDDDLVDIAVVVERVGVSSFTLGFRASVHGKVAAHGRIVIVCMNRRTQKAQPLPEAFARTLSGHGATN